MVHSIARVLAQTGTWWDSSGPRQSTTTTTTLQEVRRVWRRHNGTQFSLRSKLKVLLELNDFRKYFQIESTDGVTNEPPNFLHYLLPNCLVLNNFSLHNFFSFIWYDKASFIACQTGNNTDVRYKTLHGDLPRVFIIKTKRTNPFQNILLPFIFHLWSIIFHICKRNCKFISFSNQLALIQIFAFILGDLLPFVI